MKPDPEYKHKNTKDATYTEDGMTFNCVVCTDCGWWG